MKPAARAAKYAGTLLRIVGALQPDRSLRNLARAFRRSARQGGSYNVLGICSTGHGAAFALVSSRFGIRALNFERFLGKKYALLLAREELREIEERIGPISSGIRFVLSNRDGSMPPAAVFEDKWEEFLSALLHGLPLTARDIDVVVGSESHFAINRSWLGRALGRYFPNASVHTRVEHHAIHRFQAYFASGFSDAAVLTADACGEPLIRLAGSPLAMTLSRAAGDRIEVFAEHTYPRSSPGALYGYFNHYLGFENGEEGKTMGLSSFGRDDCYNALRPSLHLNADGSFRFLGSSQLTETLQCLRIDRRLPPDPIAPGHEDLAKAAQLLLDDIMLNAVRALERSAPSRNLCLAGGTALNSVTNERIFRASRFRNLYVMPNAGDCGHALGCALYGERVLLGRGIRRPPARQHTTLSGTDALGPLYCDSEIEKAIEAAGLQILRRDDIAAAAADLISQGLIVGWFQGGSEHGPRSLGQRSILADPRPASMKDHLNARVKHREPFRPFAPAVLEERAREYFDLEGPSPFMLRVVDVIPEKRAVIPSVTHVDGTARVQTVNALTQPLFHALISAFDQITGVPIVLNTSFNVAGRPIVETPKDAIDCYLSTEIDALVLHNYLLEKPA
jgi:carbamoyltransferase